MALLLAGSLALLLYVTAGYPLLLRLLVAVRGARPIRRAPITPRLSLVISAFNEAAVIRAKLQNAVGLDYPPDQRQIVVISDCSDDGTDEIVAEFADQGVVLARMTERRGKTAGLNATVPTLEGDIVVFSDANAMYEANALRMLARNFADPEVGCVTGEARYLAGGQAVADVGERTYWDYELQMKRRETQLGSVVGGDGAIYAIRRSLWRTLPDDAINDFLNPLQIVAAGWRGVYEPEAVCWEETAGGVKTEYRRRVRIVSRSWRAVFQARSVLNPFKVGLFAWSVWSHKVLRWASGLFVVGAGVGFLGLILPLAAKAPLWAAALVVGAAAATASVPRLRAAAATLGYFAAINAASVVGLAKGTTGRVSGVWSTPRQAAQGRGLLPAGHLFLLFSVCAVLAIVAAPLIWRVSSASLSFWIAFFALGYVYAGYPILLALTRRLRPQPITRAAIEPRVCLLVAANDEAAVIADKITNALALDYPADRLDVVVVSDGSVDGTNDIVRGFAPRVRLVEQSPRQGKIVAINRAMGTIDTEIVAFSDANTFLEPGALRALVSSFADPSVGAVSADVALVGERASLASSEDLYYMYERWVQQAESDIGSMIGADGALYAIRRRLFEPQAADTILDDMAIPMAVLRTGHRVVFEPGARASEPGVETAREEFSRKARVVAGAVQFLTRRDSSVPLGWSQPLVSLVSHKALRWLSPVFATILLTTSFALSGRSSHFAAIAMTQGILVVVGLSGCFHQMRRLPFVALAHYFLLVQAAAAVGFVRGLSGRQSVLWRRFERLHQPSEGRLQL